MSLFLYVLMVSAGVAMCSLGWPIMGTMLVVGTIAASYYAEVSAAAALLRAAPAQR